MNHNETKTQNPVDQKQEEYLKEYRKQYYKQNKEKILQKKREQVFQKMEIALKMRETKLEEFTQQLEEKKYSKITDLRTKLSKIKNDYRAMKSYTKDSVDVVYNSGTYNTWLLAVNELVLRQKDKANMEVLMKFLEQ